MCLSSGHCATSSVGMYEWSSIAMSKPPIIFGSSSRSNDLRLTSIGGSSGRTTLAQTGANWSLQSRKIAFMIVPTGRYRDRGVAATQEKRRRENVTEVDKSTSVDGSRGPDYMHRTPQHNEVE